MPGQTQKGNPASKRMSSTTHKATRQRSWYAAKTRKQQRIATQRERERANRELRAAGELTPWQAACARRSARREEAGLRAAWQKRQTD